MGAEASSNARAERAFMSMSLGDVLKGFHRHLVGRIQSAGRWSTQELKDDVESLGVSCGYHTSDEIRMVWMHVVHQLHVQVTDFLLDPPVLGAYEGRDLILRDDLLLRRSDEVKTEAAPDTAAGATGRTAPAAPSDEVGPAPPGPDQRPDGDPDHAPAETDNQRVLLHMLQTLMHMPEVHSGLQHIQAQPELVNQMLLPFMTTLSDLVRNENHPVPPSAAEGTNTGPPAPPHPK